MLKRIVILARIRIRTTGYGRIRSKNRSIKRPGTYFCNFSLQPTLYYCMTILDHNQCVLKSIWYQDSYSEFFKGKCVTWTCLCRVLLLTKIFWHILHKRAFPGFAREQVFLWNINLATCLNFFLHLRQVQFDPLLLFVTEKFLCFRFFPLSIRIFSAIFLMPILRHL